MMLATLLFALAPAVQDPAITILHPQERQVIQRDDRAGADVKLRVKAPAGIGRLTASVKPSAGGADLATATLAAVGGEPPTFGATLRVPAGGWYRMSVFVDGIAGPVEVAFVKAFGVGEVFLVAGQSNSTNSGEEKIGALDDRVSAFDGAEWTLAADPMPGVQDGSTGGSPWPVVGKALVAKLNVPVAFASCGFGGTSIAQWQKDAEPHPRTKKVLYDALLQRARAVASYRAILWHQGESDAHTGTARADYAAKFRALRDALSKDAPGGGPWVVANASFVPELAAEKMEAIRGAQQDLWKDKVALQGPDTDGLSGPMRHSRDHIHFSKAGLEAHGKLWAERLEALFFKQ